MANIVGFGSYIPWYRIGAETKGWGKRSEKAVANYDEDSLTMAVAAGRDCLESLNTSEIDRLYFASTTAPYIEKQTAATIATALDLRFDIVSVDFAGSTRAGTNALLAAVDAVNAGSARHVLVIASDMRLGKPRSRFDTSIGDGAVAILVGTSKALATLDFSYSITNEMLDVWRMSSTSYVRSWEDRFAIEEGYMKILPRAVDGILDKSKLKIGAISKVVFNAPDARRHAEMARILGLDVKTQVQDPFLNSIGDTGNAAALLVLVSALEEAVPGQKIVLANYANGADALIFTTTDKVGSFKPKLGLRKQIESKKILGDYLTYLTYRGILDIEPPMVQLPQKRPAATGLLRENDKVLRLYGGKCRRCSTVQYPKQRVCIKCKTADDFEDYKLLNKKASIYTYSMEYVAPTPDPPQGIAVLNFEGGGRMVVEMTDCNAEKMEIGMPVELTFRKLFTVDEINNYYWKGMSSRG